MFALPSLIDFTSLPLSSIPASYVSSMKNSWRAFFIFNKYFYIIAHFSRSVLLCPFKLYPWRINTDSHHTDCHFVTEADFFARVFAFYKVKILIENIVVIQ